MNDLIQLKQLLSIPKDIVITSHRNPDGDAIGSSLALYHYLNKGGHTVHVIFPSEYPDFVAWLPDAAKILIHDIEPEDSERFLKRADIIFCLDYNSLERIDKMGEVIMSLNTTTVLIDHHLYPDAFADFSLSDTTASSTCELVYDFIELLNDKELIDLKISQCLYTGILTDTGSFKYSTSPKLFRIVAHLCELGIDNNIIQDLIFNSMEEKGLRLLGHCLINRMEILEEHQTGIISLSREDYEAFDIQRGDTEGIVNYLLKLKNVKVAALITEQPKIIKLSLRSKGDYSVQAIATKYFNGGGHKNASGGAVYGTLQGTVQKFKNILPEYQHQL